METTKGLGKWRIACVYALSGLFALGVSLRVNTISVNAGVLEDIYLNECVDICDSSWQGTGDEGTYGWSNKAYPSQTLNAETVGITLEEYHHQWTNEYVLYWYGGDEGGLYNQEDSFAVEFAVRMTDDGFSLRVDQYSFWINSKWMRIGYNDQWTNDDFHRTYWFGDIGLKASWLVQKPVELSGIVKIRAYAYTENGETTFVAQAGEYFAMATTLHERKNFPSCSIIAGYEGLTVYTSEVAQAYDEVEKAKRYAEYTVVPQDKKEDLLKKALPARATLLGETLTADELSAVQADMGDCLTEELFISAKENARALLKGASAETLAQIDACKTVDELETLYKRVKDENKNPPVSSEREEDSSGASSDSASHSQVENLDCTSGISGVTTFVVGAVGLAVLRKRKKD